MVGSTNEVSRQVHTNERLGVAYHTMIIITIISYYYNIVMCR